MDLHISELMRVFKPRPLTKSDIRDWQMKFFKALEPGWNSYHSKPLEIRVVRGLLKKFNPSMLPTIYAECEKGNFSKNFWWKWKQLPTVKKKEKPKNLTMF